MLKIDNAEVFAEDHASEILTGVGIVGEEKKDELETEQLADLELIKAFWRFYISLYEE